MSKIFILLLFAFKIEAQIRNNDTIRKGFEEKLLNLLKPLNEISLHLRTQEDEFNHCIQIFITQKICPVKIYLNNFIGIEQNRNNVIFTNNSDLYHNILNYSSRFGTQFYLIESEFKPNDIIEMARSVWIASGIFRNYFITLNKVYFYNPFVITVNGSYGDLQNVTDNKDFEKIFQNINGYPIRTYIFRSVYSSVIYNESTKQGKAEGADANVAYVIEKAMNCKLVLQKPDKDFFGHRLKNGSYNGAIGRTLRYETQLVMTGFFIKNYFTKDIEFSAPVYTDKLCCFVSKAKRIPQSILPLFSVKIDMWLGFIGAAFCWAAIWSLMRKYNLWMNRIKSNTIPKELTREHQYFRILTDTWVIWVRGNVCRYPPFSSEKIFVLSLCLVSVIFGAIFESSLATVYINPLYYKDINSMKELDESQFKIYTKHHGIKDDLFFGSVYQTFQRLHGRLFLYNEKNQLVETIASKGGFAAVTRQSSLHLDDISYILTNKIHQIPECPRKYRIGYVYPKGSPYKERINELLLRLLNAGLINHWIDMMYHKAKIELLDSPDILKIMGGYKFKELTIKDLQLAFYVVVLGSFLSTFVLICEFLIVRRKSISRK